MENNLRLIHYSAVPLTAVHSAEQTSGFSSKPQGLWVSVEGPDDWKAWCEAESFSPERLAYEHDIELAEGANILRISTAREIDDFTSLYRLGAYSADWTAVAQCYDGILIAPYIWERRMSSHCDWYHLWDCASGCIWNAHAVKGIRCLRHAHAAGE